MDLAIYVILFMTHYTRGVAQDAPFFTTARLERRAGALTETGGMLVMCICKS